MGADGLSVCFIRVHNALVDRNHGPGRRDLSGHLVPGIHERHCVHLQIWGGAGWTFSTPAGILSEKAGIQERARRGSAFRDGITHRRGVGRAG